MHLSMFVDVSKMWEVKKKERKNEATDSTVEIDYIKECELDLKKLLGSLNQNTKFLINQPKKIKF